MMEQDYQFPPTDFNYTELGTASVNFPQAPRGLTEQPLAEPEAQASCGEQHKSFSLQEIKKTRKQTSALAQAPDWLRWKITLRLFVFQINGSAAVQGN